VYSNFANKDELFLSVVDRRDAKRIEEIGDLLRHDAEPAPFFSALSAANGPSEDERRRWFLVSMEVLLYALRNPSLLAAVQEREQELRRQVGRAMKTVLDATGTPPPMPIDEAAVILHAIDRGIAIQHYIDPARVTEAAFTGALAFLAKAAAALAPRRRS
jgi:AcrR family transcriptional regulator